MNSTMLVTIHQDCCWRIIRYRDAVASVQSGERKESALRAPPSFLAVYRADLRSLILDPTPGSLSAVASFAISKAKTTYVLDRFFISCGLLCGPFFARRVSSRLGSISVQLDGSYQTPVSSKHIPCEMLQRWKHA